MRKFLIFMLVLSVASVANAGFVTLNGSGQSSTTVGLGAGTVTLYLQTTTADVMMEDVEWATSSGTLANGQYLIGSRNTDYDYAGAGTAAGRYEIVSGWDVTTTTFATNTNLVSFDVQYNFTGTDITITGYDVYSVDTGWNPLSAAVAGHTLVPEPMTIALLGLGGLFLRRRK